MFYDYLLDTNIVSDLIKHPTGKIFSKIKSVGENKICTSIIVACELRFGANKKQSSKLQKRVALTLQMIDILPLNEPIDQKYAEIRANLEKQGMPIGPNDLLIAAQTLALDLTLVTANTKEFSRIPYLKLENWLA